jgi:class 3 adenylate cyclase/Flp pilus assembly protein TadD
MSSSGLRQRLAAILAADASGYSRLMGDDERATVAALDAARSVFREGIEANDGRVIDMAGDAVLAVFALASAALSAALAIQQKLASSAAAVRAERRLRFRIGVHLGEIIEKADGTVYGDGVNIAARIQSIAMPGGICVTQQVYDQVRHKAFPPLLEVGVRELKNIQVPVRVFRVILPGEGIASPRLAQWMSRAVQSANRRRALIALGALAAGAGAWRLLRPAAHVPDPRAAELFTQARGLVSYSSSHLENKANNARAIELLEQATAIDPKFAEAHAKLGLAYVIRLFLFAPEERELQQKAYLSIERAIQLNAQLAEAYEARGRLLWTPFNHFPHQDAIRDFRRALKLNPEADEAHHYLGLVYLHVGLLQEGRREFREAIRINPSNNGAQYRVGESYFYEQNYREALKVFETIDPAFNPDLHSYQSAWAQFRLGQKEQALARIARSLEAYPGDQGGLLASTRGMIYAAGGEHAKAQDELEIAGGRRGFGHFHHTEYNIACGYAMMKRIDAALDWFEKATHEGFNCYPVFESDEALAALRGHERFEAMLSEERKKAETYRALFSR